MNLLCLSTDVTCDVTLPLIPFPYVTRRHNNVNPLSHRSVTSSIDDQQLDMCIIGKEERLQFEVIRSVLRNTSQLGTAKNL